MRFLTFLCLLLVACTRAIQPPPSLVPKTEIPQRSSSPAAISTRGILDPRRVTKKPFGILIDSTSSPVQPERFRGYHTGADFEVTSDEEALPVPALCDGEVLTASLLKNGTAVVAGQTVGHLGAGYSRETDDERPHLHLSIHRGAAVDLRGYVQRQEELKGWMNPVVLLSTR